MKSLMILLSFLAACLFSGCRTPHGLSSGGISPSTTILFQETRVDFPFGPDKPLAVSCLYLRDNDKYAINSDRILVSVTNLSAVSLPVSPNRCLKIVYLQCIEDGNLLLGGDWEKQNPPIPDDAQLPPGRSATYELKLATFGKPGEDFLEMNCGALQSLRLKTDKSYDIRVRLQGPPLLCFWIKPVHFPRFDLAWIKKNWGFEEVDPPHDGP